MPFVWHHYEFKGDVSLENLRITLSIVTFIFWRASLYNAYDSPTPYAHSVQHFSQAGNLTQPHLSDLQLEKKIFLHT